jgi:hypothetical protein
VPVGGLKLEVRLFIDGDTTIAELLSTSTSNEGWFDGFARLVISPDGQAIAGCRLCDPAPQPASRSISRTLD